MTSPFMNAAAVIAALLLSTTKPEQATAQEAADIPQIEGALGGVASVTQHGNGNTAAIDQRAVASGLADLTNNAVITQFGNENSALISQEGSANSADIAQDGSHNQGAILQQHSGGNAELQQSGNGLSITIEQFGAGTPGSAPIQVIQTN
jgi:Curlin associated repeat